jgi:serine/threonine-protein kinase RsbW
LPVQHLDEDPCTTVRMPHAPGTSDRARVMMRDELVVAGLRPAVVNDAQIVIGELVTNATEHGRPDSEGNVEISWCLHDDRLRISVYDGGDVPELRAIPFTDDSLRGRGLAMVDYLCDRWEHDSSEGTRVTAELHYA